MPAVAGVWVLAPYNVTIFSGFYRKRTRESSCEKAPQRRVAGGYALQVWRAWQGGRGHGHEVGNKPPPLPIDSLRCQIVSLSVRQVLARNRRRWVGT